MKNILSDGYLSDGKHYCKKYSKHNFRNYTDVVCIYTYYYTSRSNGIFSSQKNMDILNLVKTPKTTTYFAKTWKICFKLNKHKRLGKCDNAH